MKERIANDPGWREELIKRSKKALWDKGPNIPEANVIGLGIPSLTFTGDGSLPIQLNRDDGSIWNKFPDFSRIQHGEVTHVVEIMDLVYWHSLDEIDPLISKYAAKDIACMVVNAVDCYDNANLQHLRKKIVAFLGLE
jgi:hypothetical protein